MCDTNQEKKKKGFSSPGLEPGGHRREGNMPKDTAITEEAKMKKKEGNADPSCGTPGSRFS